MTTTEPAATSAADAIRRHLGDPTAWDSRAAAATAALTEIRREIADDPDGIWKSGQYATHCWELEGKLAESAKEFAEALRTAADRYDQALAAAENAAVRWRSSQAETAKTARRAEAAKLVAEQHARRIEERSAVVNEKLAPAGLTLVHDTSTGRYHIATLDRGNPYLPGPGSVVPVPQFDGPRRRGIRRSTYYAIPAAAGLTLDQAERWARRLDTTATKGNH
ncbi:hypothetical protein GV791_01765 [Nocardia cyriacigeorgica]|uniref:Uncharacterized protein n=1 Tax=Nocardia cyriacigeorgica TaxID=135487 RepID=A0A6P1CHD9_9NOCA|nr:hypothetical protein [Nocardia cyriacigeorgica]MBF6288154.1 hypothetical protein [Nocardia cyriacigeorgica]NEW31287.1 hypothetical protein [Nocardia cyriacigeorgica]